MTDDERATAVYLKAVSDTVDLDDLETDVDLGDLVTHDPPVPERLVRLRSDAALSADEAARHEHQRRVVAPLLMLLALGLLFAAGWSC